ncbi:MAG TPA: hypothetical protein DIT97_10325 [Gimesia maris]|uniref:Uncharacterized protein n=1 Tax=Gimesia maris TaxID=122 RepID=A0A3D3R3L8_9PLAN|nr:hypothetical protein [Gimesia maris]|tara:strand:+ start:1693 stop:2619 length:927 start_codon:yes stop_codon:yes gene_type:complete
MSKPHLSDDWLAWGETLPEHWSSIINDPELHPEIRDNSVTAYYRGAALIRNLSPSGETFTGDVHFKYVPVHTTDGSEYLRFSGNAQGLRFENNLEPQNLGDCGQDVLNEFKRKMRSVVQHSESQIIHHIASHPANVIIDQEILLQTTGSSLSEKLNLCHYDTQHQSTVFVKINMIHDSRLKADADQVPEIIQQLKRFREQIEKHHQTMIDTYQRTVAIKRQIGLSEGVEAIPPSGPSQLMKKVLLVIGGCSQQDIESVLNGEGEWSVFREAVEKEAAGLILCGMTGSPLVLEPGSQSLIFDTSVYNAS